MKKLIMFIICLLVFPVCLLFTGCGASNGNSNHDFEMLSVSKFNGDNYTVIVVHKKTKVMYCFYRDGYSGGLTVMLNPDGTPMIYEGELNG